MGSKKKYLFYLFLSLLYILGFYLISLNRDWQHFDEWSMYVDEGFFPITNSFSELIEVINRFAFNYHIESQNSMFSNIVNIRSNTLGAILQILIMNIFKSDSIFYHILQVTLHLLNTSLVWIIFYNILTIYKVEKNIYFYSTFFSLIWAIHPSIIETTHLVTNWTALISYLICLVLLLISITKFKNENLKFNFIDILCSISFFISLLVSEYTYSFPLIIFFLILSFFIQKENLTFHTIQKTFIITLPYICGIFFYVVYYSIRSFLSTNENLLGLQLCNFSIERILWLSPQLLTYYLKLILFPINLSIYQTILIHLAKNYFDPIFIFSFLVFLFFLFFPIFKKQYLMLFSFLFSLFPFLHILAPTYCLIAERYLYIPIFMFLIFIISIVFSKKVNEKILIPILCICLFLLSTKTFLRLNEWKNSQTLYIANLKISKTNYELGIANSILGYYYATINNKEKTKKYMEVSVHNFEKAITELDKKNNYHETSTLKQYGLDSNSLILKSAYRISDMKLYYLDYSPKLILDFYEPFITKNFKNAGSHELNLYARLLELNNRNDEAYIVLLKTKEKFPYSPGIISSLSNFYLEKKDLASAESIIKEGLKIYPNYKKIIKKMITLCEMKKDGLKLAHYEYLYGLLSHSIEAYQKALQIYLAYNNLTLSETIIKRLLYLDNENPITYLLISKFYLIKHDTENAIQALNSSYKYGKTKYLAGDLEKKYYESILLSLLSFSLENKNINEIYYLIKELESLPELMPQSKLYIESIKKKINE